MCSPAGVLALGFPIFRLFNYKTAGYFENILNNLKHATDRLRTYAEQSSGGQLTKR
jgi:hypothetical protein